MNASQYYEIHEIDEDFRAIIITKLSQVSGYGIYCPQDINCRESCGNVFPSSSILRTISSPDLDFQNSNTYSSTLLFPRRNAVSYKTRSGSKSESDFCLDRARIALSPNSSRTDDNKVWGTAVYFELSVART